jgi:DNA-binding Xre family transcriptional regulator
MDDYKSIVSYQTQDHGYIRIKLRQLLDERQVTRNKLRTLTGVKYDVINRYYQAERVQMVDLDFLAKVCCVFGCEISDLLNTACSREPVRKTNNQKSAGNRSVPG